MSNKPFHYQAPFPLKKDDTEYYLLTSEHVSVSEFEGQEILKVAPEALTLLARQAFHDASFMLRPAHQQQVADILRDPEASENDKYVALQFLRNSDIAAKGVLPTCQDTGTAIIVGKKGQRVWTGGGDEAALARGVYNTYIEDNLRYSQNAPLDMYKEVNTGTNLPAQIDLYAVDGDEYKFLCIAKGGGSANKTYLYQETKALLTPGKLKNYLVEKMRTLGTAACPPYHIAFVIGGTSAETNLKTVKLASAKYYDELPTEGNEHGQAFRDVELEKELLIEAQNLGLGAQSGRIDAVNEYNQKVQLTFNNLKTDGSSTLASFGERVGNQKLSLEKMTISVEGKELALLEGMEISGKSDLVNDGKTINSQLDYSLNSLKVQNQDLGSGKLTLKVGQIDGEAWHQFSQQYNAQTQALLAQPEIANNPELYQEKVTEAFFSALPLMLKGDPVITIAPLSWKNSQGESALNLSLFLKDPATTKEAPQTLAQEVDRSVKSLDAKLTIPVDMATEFMTQVAKLEGYQEDQAKKLAKQQVEGASAMGQMFRLTTLQDNTITTSLQYANGQITLNGQKMSLEDFVGMFAMPALNVPAVPAIPQQ